MIYGLKKFLDDVAKIVNRALTSGECDIAIQFHADKRSPQEAAEVIIRIAEDGVRQSSVVEGGGGI